MKIAKFQGTTMREALARVKRELGSDAIVVSTRQVRRGLMGTGIEVSAAIDEDDPPVVPERRAPSTPTPRAGLAEQDVERIMAPLRSELRWLRSMLKSKADARGDESVRAELRAVRRLLEQSSSADVESEPLDDVARKHRLARRSVGRVVALVGPTGVGKTTTIAKLAARTALMQGLDVGVVTLDDYRVGGEQQMRIFTDLIGVPLHVASSPAELCRSIDDLAHCDVVFVDTAGRSPRDTPALEALERTFSEVTDIEVHLTIAATSSAQMIDALYQRYQRIGVSRLLFTKLDEALELSELVRAPARLGTPISYVATGQAVPEDLHEATATVLLDLARQGFDQCVNAA